MNQFLSVKKHAEGNPPDPAKRSDHTTKEQLLRLFDNGCSVTYQQIEKHLDIGERQARRLLRQLQNDGVPIEEARVGRTKTFSVREGHRRATIGPIAFTEQESLALAIAAGAAQAVLGATPLATPVHSAFARLLGRLRPRLPHVDIEEQSARWYIRATAQTRCDSRRFHDPHDRIE